jgi:hypothetical protein
MLWSYEGQGWLMVVKRRTRQNQLEVTSQMRASIGWNSFDEVRALVGNADTHFGADTAGKVALRDCGSFRPFVSVELQMTRRSGATTTPRLIPVRLAQPHPLSLLSSRSHGEQK